MSKAQLNTFPDSPGFEASDSDELTEDYKNAETLRRLYWNEGLSQSKIGEHFGVSQQTIGYWMGKHGIEARTPNCEKPPSVSLATGGYPRVNVRNPNGGFDSIAVHRLAAVAEHGFEAVTEPNTVVHHRNGCPFDHSVSNLEVLTYSEHARRHHAYDGTEEVI